jgi:hypothetical protein
MNEDMEKGLTLPNLNMLLDFFHQIWKGYLNISQLPTVACQVLCKILCHSFINYASMLED